MTSPDVCVADVNNFSIMEKEKQGGGGAAVIASEKMSNKGQQCKQIGSKLEGIINEEIWLLLKEKSFFIEQQKRKSLFTLN